MVVNVKAMAAVIRIAFNHSLLHEWAVTFLCHRGFNRIPGVPLFCVFKCKAFAESCERMKKSRYTHISLLAAMLIQPSIHSVIHFPLLIPNHYLIPSVTG